MRASANRCKQPDQVLLSCGFVLVGDGAELGGVALDGLTAGLAERFETSGGVVLTGGMLADLEPQKVTARLAALWNKGVRKAGLLRLEFEP